MKPIVKIPEPVLTQKAKKVTAFDKKLTRIIEDMKHTLLSATNPKGVGLAAPQVGIPLNIFLTKPTENSPIRVFINPTIISQDPPHTEKIKNKELEGCLSIPGVWGTVHRSPKLTLSYQDETGTTHQEEITGFLATIVQHEVDHLQGILFTQRVLEQHNPFYQATKNNQGKEVLEEIVI